MSESSEQILAKKKKIPVIFLYENLRRYNAYTLFCTALPLKMGDVIDVIH